MKKAVVSWGMEGREANEPGPFIYVFSSYAVVCHILARSKIVLMKVY